MSALSRIAETGTALAAKVTEAAEAAETLILTSGPVPSETDTFNDTLDAFVHELSGHDYPKCGTDELVDADSKRVQAAYAIGVAVGIRLAGGMQ